MIKKQHNITKKIPESMSVAPEGHSDDSGMDIVGMLIQLDIP